MQFKSIVKSPLQDGAYPKLVVINLNYFPPSLKGMQPWQLPVWYLPALLINLNHSLTNLHHFPPPLTCSHGSCLCGSAGASGSPDWSQESLPAARGSACWSTSSGIGSAGASGSGDPDWSQESLL